MIETALARRAAILLCGVSAQLAVAQVNQQRAAEYFKEVQALLVAAPEPRRFARAESWGPFTVWTLRARVIANAPKCVASPSLSLRLHTQPFCAGIVDESSI